MNIESELFARQDLKYKAFQSSLIPNIDSDTVIGVRVPEIRKLAKQIKKDQPLMASFLGELPHSYYDENLLHGFLISEIRDFDSAINELTRFLPYIDNWAVCDGIKPVAIKTHRSESLPYIRAWIQSPHAYICRLGMSMLMAYYLDDAFLPEYLDYPASVTNTEYYVNMMRAWFFATALAKQWETTIPYLETNRLPLWTHNKTIQKARESFRITDTQKAYLKTLKRKL